MRALKLTALSVLMQANVYIRQKMLSSVLTDLFSSGNVLFVNPTPLLLISDAPSAGTGLARITKDLATRIHANLQDVFRVGTFGYGGAGSRHLPFPQYNWTFREDWIMPEIIDVWQDFSGGEDGVIMTISDASRLLWLSRPEMCADPRLRAWKRPKLWGYWPIDATGPNNQLSGILQVTIKGYDRNLAYSAWAQKILANSGIEAEQLPHGIDTSVFKPRHRMTARHGFGERIGARKNDGRWINIGDDAMAIGIVATNQARKDFGLGIQTVAELAKDRNVFLWIKTDKMERHWSIPGLVNDFGISDRTVITIGDMTDEEMSWAYSAMDVTLGIGLGEGFGYPIFESLACGTPCIHGSDGGAPEHMEDWMVVRPYRDFQPSRVEGVYNCYRFVHDTGDWIRAISSVGMSGETYDNTIVSLPLQLDWNNLWPRWESWFRKGIA